MAQSTKFFLIFFVLLIEDRSDSTPRLLNLCSASIGGRTEYVITIACMIGKSRMKGEKVVTSLVPYGAEKPSAGMLKSFSTYSVEIFWNPPKGDFGKYVLSVDKLSEKPIIKPESLIRMQSLAKSANSSANNVASWGNSEFNQTDNPDDLTREIRAIEISRKLTTYTILGLDPGEKYRIVLGTKTGNVETRQSIEDVILTRPLPPKGIF